uniref:Peroxisomal leader peptide-processing protease n=1 Tax=Anopheles dirus TaxID=7168 RepID=A0A182NLW8_9DIPT
MMRTNLGDWRLIENTSASGVREVHCPKVNFTSNVLSTPPAWIDPLTDRKGTGAARSCQNTATRGPAQPRLHRAPGRMACRRFYSARSNQDIGNHVIPTIPQHGTIFYASGEQKASAVFLNEELVITSGLILSDNKDYAEIVTNAVKQCPVLDIGKSTALKPISQLDFRVVRKQNDVLHEQAARALHLVHSRRVNDCLEKLLDGLHACLNGEVKPIRAYTALYASIIILSTNTSKFAPRDWDQIKTVLDRLNPESSDPPRLLDQVITVSTPFGNESFFNTLNVGHVSNMFGEHDCVLLLDTHLTFGCHGGAVYNRNMRIQGFLMGSTFVYRNENISLPLAINIEEILSITLNRRHLCQSRNISFPEQAFRSVCMIDSQGCWGTGCAFELNRKQYIISCSHVLATDNITCVFNDRKVVTPRLVYKNPIFDSAYDIALMEASFDEAQSPNWFCRLADYIPSIGQRLYAIGFPVFKSLASCGAHFRPSIIPGRATKYCEGILYTDCSIQCGQSGGPIFDENGLLVAIAVSNFKSSLDNHIHNCHNMCVPVRDIYNVLVKFSETNDKSTLQGLEANWNIKCKWKLKPPTILNKL